jgi:hypothetical protein
VITALHQIICPRPMLNQINSSILPFISPLAPILRPHPLLCVTQCCPQCFDPTCRKATVKGAPCPFQYTLCTNGRQQPTNAAAARERPLAVKTAQHSRRPQAWPVLLQRLLKIATVSRLLLLAQGQGLSTTSKGRRGARHTRQTCRSSHHTAQGAWPTSYATASNHLRHQERRPHHGTPVPYMGLGWQALY